MLPIKAAGRTEVTTVAPALAWSFVWTAALVTAVGLTISQSSATAGNRVLGPGLESAARSSSRSHSPALS